MGYVAGPYILPTITYCKTMTYTRYTQLDQETAHQRLDDLIRHNLEHLKQVLDYNRQNQVHFYRLSHNIIPLATHPMVSLNYIEPYQQEWQALQQVIKQDHIRLDTHPDQFCVLNSVSESVVAASRLILEYNDQLFRCLDINGKMILHGGGAQLGKRAAMHRFTERFLALPQHLQQRIILENDDRIYTVEDILSLCQKLNVPMVLDYHHFLCNQNGKKLSDFLPEIKKTWDQTGLPCKVHFSSPRSMKDKRAHSDYADLKGFLVFLEKISDFDCDVDVMLECKAKEAALFRLVHQLKFYTDFVFLDQTTFLLPKGYCGKLD